MTLVKDVMTLRPTSVAPGERLDVAVALLSQLGVRHLPVCEGGRLEGMVSVRDILRATPPAGEATPGEAARRLRALEVRSIMTAPAVTALLDEPVGVAARRMMARRISALPVLADESGSLVGMLSEVDLLELAVAKLEADPGGVVPVRWLMTPRPLQTVSPDEPIDLALSLMRGDKIRHLPVVDGAQLVGILSDRDVLAAETALDDADARAAASRLAHRHGTHVRDIMTPHPLTAAPSDPGTEAALRLAQHRIGALPVLDEGALVGILTISDFLFYLRTADSPQA